NWQGTWSSTTAYAVDNAIAYNGSSYISIQAGTNHEPDTSPLFWTLLSQAGNNGTSEAQGPQGPTGPTGLNRQGTWRSTTTSAVNAAIAYNGSSYISIQAGTNHEPDTS